MNQNERLVANTAYSVVNGLLEALFLFDEKTVPLIRETLARVNEQIDDPNSWSYFHINEDDGEYNYLKDVTQAIIDHIEKIE